MTLAFDTGERMSGCLRRVLSARESGVLQGDGMELLWTRRGIG